VDQMTYTIPTAADQTSLSPDEVLHSGNAGMIVERTGQLRNEFRSEGRQFARAVAEYLNTRQSGIATAFVYEETFGTKDRIHWFIHMKSLSHYETLVQMGDVDEEYRNLFSRDWIPETKGGGPWSRMFLDGGLHETVILPQFWGMYGTRATSGESATDTFPIAESWPGAEEQTAIPRDQILHSANSGIIIHRTGQIEYDFRSEARQFAREAADAININLPGEATAFTYEEAFGRQDHIHWLIHLKSLRTYQRLVELHVRDESVRDVFFRARIDAERGGGTWARMFVPGSIADTALTPQHWGMYATQRPEAHS
jgi:hypothetical protein